VSDTRLPAVATRLGRATRVGGIGHQTTSINPLSLLPPADMPVQFRIDEATRRRGMRHIAEIRAQLAARQSSKAA
jgi:hypothetical protein